MTSFDRDQVVSLLDTACGASPPAVDAIQRHGLASLLTGQPATLSEISQQSGIDIADISAGVTGLQEAGRIETRGDHVIGVGGLTTTSTAHTLALPEATMHTWCALDAIGIPIALDLDAQASTTCPHCGTELRVEIRNGQTTPDDSVRLFCPTAPCADVRADFCAAANLFCNSDHLNAWTATHPTAQGQELTLTETVDLGSAMWGPHKNPTTQPDSNG